MNHHRIVSKDATEALLGVVPTDDRNNSHKNAVGRGARVTGAGTEGSASLAAVDDTGGEQETHWGKGLTQGRGKSGKADHVVEGLLSTLHVRKITERKTLTMGYLTQTLSGIRKQTCKKDPVGLTDGEGGISTEYMSTNKVTRTTRTSG